jgi:cystathionine gamma-synthase/methionine-gamma-lyase
MDEWAFETRAVHGGRDGGPVQDPDEPRPEGLGTPVAPGIQVSSGYYFPHLGELNRAFEDPNEGYVYARHGGPTTDLFAQAVASLEGADGAVSFASGMAAIHAALLVAEVGPEDTIVVGRDLYGATQTLLTTIFATQGVRVRLVDVTNIEAAQAAVAEAHPKVVYVETISNPLLRIPNLVALAECAHQAGAAFVMDNTFASPFLCRPAELGADVVVHSVTKYLSGHGDVTAGVVAAKREFLAPLQTVARLVGGTLGPFEAWLALRGVRTLPLRMERHCANALRLAERLRAHPAVQKVHYPGLADHPQHELARRLFGGRGFGGVVSFEIREAGAAEVARFMDGLRLVLPAPTMGDVYSLALYPAQASHRGLTPEQRTALGIGDNLVRISVGIEAADDIIADVEEALAAV